MKNYLTVSNGSKAKSMETATKVAEKLGVDFDKVEIVTDGIGFYLEEKTNAGKTEIVNTETNPISIPQGLHDKLYSQDNIDGIDITTPTEFNKKIVSKEKSVTSAEDALQILRDHGIEIATKQEAKEYSEMSDLKDIVLQLAQSNQLMLEQNKLQKEQQIAYEIKDKKSDEVALKKLNEDGKKSDNKIKAEPTVSMMIVRRRNAHGTSIEKQRTAYGKNGELLRDAQGASYKTEVAEICLNNKIYTYDLGADIYGRSEGSITIHNVPWSVAVNLAERRYPQVLFHPETGEKVEPFYVRNKMVTPQNQLRADGTPIQSSIGASLSS